VKTRFQAFAFKCNLLPLHGGGQLRTRRAATLPHPAAVHGVVGLYKLNPVDP
jgi:hypothetical protein